jgi:GT2 family glycosyltransferase
VSEVVALDRPAPRATVVIPTHDRCESLRRLLDALAVQTVPARSIEVVVVADGCSDGTAELVRTGDAPYDLRLIELPASGAATARNRGAAAARAGILVFLDDDIEPLPGLLEAFLAEHAREPGRMVIGCSLPVVEVRSFHDAELRRWWMDHILSMQHVGHRFGYRDMHSGNFSIAAETFSAVGGFDEAIPCREDYELGMRLLAHGVTFAYCRAAAGYHYDNTDLDRSLDRAFQEGRGDVLIAQRHPELGAEVRRTLAGSRRGGIGRLLRWSRIEASRAWVRRRWTGALDWAHLRRRAVGSHGRLRAYWYRRGAESELGSAEELQRFMAAAAGERGAPETLLDVDLREGFDAARRLLDEERPAGARLRFGGFEVGILPPVPGAEPLRGRHLAAAPVDWGRMLGALAVEVAGSPRSLTAWSGKKRRFAARWGETGEQRR